MNSNKAKLSKSILEMKFMKRTKEKVEKELDEEEGEQYFGSHLTDWIKTGSQRFITEPSYVFCEKLVDGRKSFQGMNAELEKLMEKSYEDKVETKPSQQETDVTDKEMVKQWKRSHKRRKVN